MNEHSCQVCPSRFSRPEHLKRHAVSHNNARPDSLRRHERTCKSRQYTFNSHVDHTSRGDFDETHLVKRRCYSTQDEKIAPLVGSKNAIDPLPNCPEVSEFPAASSLEWGNTSTDSFFETDPSNWRCSLFKEKEIAPFSDSFLESGQDLLQNIPSPLDFSALDLLFSSQINSDIIKAERLEHLAYFTSSMGMSTFTDRETFRWSQNMIANAYNDNFGLMQSTTETYPESDKLTTKATEIVESLRKTIANKRNNDVIKFDWSPAIYTQCQDFYSPGNIRRFLQYFWSLWYPNCPIIHKPLFDACKASPALLCVMVLIGACLSPSKNDVQDARKWLDCVEELIFSHESFRDSYSRRKDDTDWKKERLQSIQAGYLVCSLQKREGPGEAQARIRRYRHASMVTLARHIGIGTASHRHLEINRDSQSWWREFAEQEELMRTIIFVFLIDAALVIFHNSPPRVVVSELKMDVSCPEACFQAESATECLLQLEEWTKTRFWRNRSSMVSVVRRICQNQIDEEMVREFSQLGTLNLFTVVQAIHSLMFHLQNSLVFEATLAPVQTGLENWRRIWDQRVPEDFNIPQTPETLWKQMGFLRHASEFWHLARIKAAKIVSSAGDDCEDEIQEPSRYDHTDMGDVNGLIMEYRRLNLGMT
ncbi:uncharacterized protein N7529_003214 [Penicillium soppii]|uniref:uncharacterized protein n=1 Tax=Penicillium soppii TaxID=69789 RepID=UPI0025470716|nr:uncharacterized protein N7529_003214 [Penicillium soppii]KAJ5874784.1 hypothetical protein N7529_003214 [Penicillium soppii]